MSDERYNNTGRLRSNWQKIRDPQQKADAFPVNEPGKILYGAMPDLVKKYHTCIFGSYSALESDGNRWE